MQQDCKCTTSCWLSSSPCMQVHVESSQLTSPLLFGSSVKEAPMAAAALSKVARAVAAAAAGTGTTLTWQWLPPDLRNAMKRSKATASLPCSRMHWVATARSSASKSGPAGSTHRHSFTQLENPYSAV